MFFLSQNFEPSSSYSRVLLTKRRLHQIKKIIKGATHQEEGKYRTGRGCRFLRRRPRGGRSPDEDVDVNGDDVDVNDDDDDNYDDYDNAGW